jgi:hypothetical protein
VRNTRTSIIGLLVLAVFAFSAVAAASASAAELEQIPSSGTFTIASGAGTFETTGGTKLACGADKGSGKLTGVKTDESTVTFEKCKSSGISCSNVETSIKSELVWLNKSAGLAGEKLELTKPAKVTCFIISLEVTGATLCPVEPVNKKTKELKIVCKQTKGKQQYTEYENEKGEKFKATTKTGKEESGLEDTETLTLATEGEIKVA